MIMNRNLRGMLLASAALLAGASGVAHASGYGLRETTADQLGNAFVGGAAKAYDASTVWYNPAGMALLDDNEFEAGLSLHLPDGRLQRQQHQPAHRRQR